MREAWLIASRELAAYLKSPLGYIVAWAALFADGILFNLDPRALGSESALSSDVLRMFFYYTGGLVVIASIVLTMRTFAEERQTGTFVLLQTAPVREWQVVFGKFLAAFLMLSFIIALSIYMPMLIFVNGRISIGQMAAGYIGLLAIGAAATAMGVFASSLARSQILAAVINIGIVFLFIVAWKAADVASPPISSAIGYLAIMDKHFIPTFTKGLVHGQDLFFFASLAFVFLTATSKVLAARRWAG